MKLLLDTHILLWSQLSPERLERRVGKLINDPRSDLWVSPASALEILTLCHKGRMRLDGGPVDWFKRTALHLGALEATVTNEVALETYGLPLPHRDPIDALLVASAKVYGLTLVTSDENLIRSKACSILPNV